MHMECFHDQELKLTDKGHSRAMDADSRAGQTTGQENLAVLQEEEAPLPLPQTGHLAPFLFLQFRAQEG